MLIPSKNQRTVRYAFDQNDVLIEGRFALGCAHAKGAHLPNNRAKTKAHVLGFCEFHFIFPPAGGKTLRGTRTADACAASGRGVIESLEAAPLRNAAVFVIARSEATRQSQGSTIYPKSPVQWCQEIAAAFSGPRKDRRCTVLRQRRARLHGVSFREHTKPAAGRLRVLHERKEREKIWSVVLLTVLYYYELVLEL